MWPDNWQSVHVFASMRTQWRAGPAGYYGLDLNVLPEFWERLKVEEKSRDDVFADLLVMESGALALMQEKRDRKAH